MADQPPRTTVNCPVFQISSPVTSQLFTNQMSPAIVSPSSSSHVLTSSNLRPRSNYTVVSNSQVTSSMLDTQQYVVQPTTRTTVPQYVSTNSVRHIIPSSSPQSSNVTYMLPSGAHIVRMNNVITTTIATDQRPNTQIILTANSQKSSSKSTNSTTPENSPASGSGISRTLSVTTPTFQKPGANVTKLATAAYYSQFKGNESPPKISFRSKPNEQKPGTSIILTPNSNSKNVSISNLSKSANYMQIPLIQKSGALIKPNVDVQQPKSQHQPIRSVILPSNYRTTTVSSQQSTDCKLLLSSLNLPTQVLNSNDKPNISNIPVSNIQQLNTNYIQIPMTQKPGANVHVGQLPQTSIRSVILPANYRTATTNVGTPRLPNKGGDYRLILKPVNIQQQVIKNVPPTRFSVRQNPPLRNIAPRQVPPNVRPTTPLNRPTTPLNRPTTPLNRPTTPLNRPSTARIQNEIIADSKIKPIPPRERNKQLVISEKSIQICVDEYNTNLKPDQSSLNLTSDALELIQAEVTYRLFYLLRECKKYLMRCRSNVLSEDTVRNVCTEYFATFYGNKLWPLFCLKPNDDNNSNPETDDNRIWMRKHNNVNLIGWIKHPKFSLPSYYRKRSRNYLAKKKLTLDSLMNVSETVYEYLPKSLNDASTAESKVFYQSLKTDQVPFTSVLQKNNSDILIPPLLTFMDMDQNIHSPSSL